MPPLGLMGAPESQLWSPLFLDPINLNASKHKHTHTQRLTDLVFIVVNFDRNHNQ